MRILEAANALGLGGTEKVLCTFARHLMSMGHDVKIIGFNAGGVRGEQAAEAGIEVHDLKGDVLSWEKLLKEADVLHWHGNGHLNKKVFGSLAKYRPRFVVQTNVFGLAEKSTLYNFVDLDLYVSEMCLVRRMQQDGESGRLFNHKRRVLYNPIDIDLMLSAMPDEEQIKKKKQELGLSNHFVVGRIGRADDYKFDLATVDAMPYILKDFPKTKFLLVGPTERIRQHVCRRGLSHCFVYVNCSSDLKELLTLYKCIDILLAVSSVGETFGMLFAEAMVCEIPVVTASTPDNDNAQVEIVRNGIDGLITEKIPRLLGEATCYLLSKPALRKEMGINGRKGAQQRFDARRIVQALDQIVRQGETPLNPIDGTLMQWNQEMISRYQKRCQATFGQPTFIEKMQSDISRTCKRYLHHMGWAKRIVKNFLLFDIHCRKK